MSTTTNVSTVNLVEDTSWRCQGTTKQGYRCSNYRSGGEVYCRVHRLPAEAPAVPEGGEE